MTEIPEMFSVEIAYAVSTDLLVEGQTTYTVCSFAWTGMPSRPTCWSKVKQLTPCAVSQTTYTVCSFRLDWIPDQSKRSAKQCARARKNYRSLTNAYKTKTEVFGSQPSTYIEMLETQTTCFMTFQNQCGAACKKIRAVERK